jgi:hypothetical protein
MFYFRTAQKIQIFQNDLTINKGYIKNCKKTQLNKKKIMHPHPLLKLESCRRTQPTTLGRRFCPSFSNNYLKTKIIYRNYSDHYNTIQTCEIQMKHFALHLGA